MKASQAGLDLIAYFEGYSPSAYPDPATGGQPWTIGHGHTKGVLPGDRCDRATALHWLAEDVAEAEAAVDRLVTVNLTQEQFDGLVSFTFNCGAGSLQSSTLLKMVNAGDFDGAEGQFARWNQGAGRVMAGLVKRRHDEAAMFAGRFEA